MSGWTIALLVIGFDAVFVPLLIWGMVRGAWKPIEERYPRVQPEPDALRREFQSIRLDMLNLGLSVHLAVDSRFLHIEPAKIIRLFGAGAFSVPWEAISDVRIKGRYGRASLSKTTLTAPAWALELAKPADSSVGG